MGGDCCVYRDAKQTHKAQGEIEKMNEVNQRSPNLREQVEKVF